MPRIFDNIESDLLPALKETISISERGDFCVGYFNLRGWKVIDRQIGEWDGGDDKCCRLLIGMNRLPYETLKELVGALQDELIDNATILRLKKKAALEFRNQLMIGAPTNDDEQGLRRLAKQLKAKKLVVKLFLRHNLHAKLYLLFRNDPISPKVGFLGSSNLTFSGLKYQGELNVDVVEQDACTKLSNWFDERWDDRCCIDISEELLEIINESWAREDLVPPYHIYLKIAYHLSREARQGLTEFRLPREFEGQLFDFQTAAVKIAAHHLNKRGGVLIGDVVGLGKTIMATAVARIREQDHGTSTLIICPKNLVPMWQHYSRVYGLHAMVVPVSRVETELQTVPARFRLVLIDESHNLRNREGSRYRAIHEFIRTSDSKVILLSATPYNKTYLDLSNQLRLFYPEDRDLGIRPETFIRERDNGELELQRMQVDPRTLAAFEKSEYSDDWRELMRLFLVRRTRSFIQENYAEVDCECGASIKAVEPSCEQCGQPKLEGAKRYLTFADGTKSYFPVRTPKAARFKIQPDNPDDQYASLFSDTVVDTINNLTLPRYGLGNYIDERPDDPPTAAEAQIIADLSRAGRRLMGFCRTNLFKRLESSGKAFVLSMQRHILRNYICIYAIENSEPAPIGSQDASLLDSRFTDKDGGLFSNDDNSDEQVPDELTTDAAYRARAAAVYQIYRTTAQRRFRWISSDRFQEQLIKDLQSDNDALIGILNNCGPWNPSTDEKLKKLERLIKSCRKDNKKVLVFSQFADTVDYLVERLGARGMDRLAAVTGNTDSPTKLAQRFSPASNNVRDQVSESEELHVLIATDVLSEGQNLQDAAVVVNFDLPWAIIRLIQRAGRVDRIGQKAEEIFCHTFLPAQGVEQIINLRGRLRQRLNENAEVVGTDEAFFDDDRNNQAVRDLFTERAGILDGDADGDVDLGSQAYEIWKNAIELEPRLQKTIPDLPNVVYSTKSYDPGENRPEGVLAYIRTANDNDALAWLDANGKFISQSQVAILNAAKCEPDTPAVPRHDWHHESVATAVKAIAKDERLAGGQLGSPSGARFKTYERLKRFVDQVEGTLFDNQELRRALQDVYNYPFRREAVTTINRQLRTNVTDDDLARIVMDLREDGKLSIIHDEEETQEPRIICSLGLAAPAQGDAQ